MYKRSKTMSFLLKWCDLPDSVVFLDQKIFFMSSMSFHFLWDPASPLNFRSELPKQMCVKQCRHIGLKTEEDCDNDDVVIFDSHHSYCILNLF